MSKVDAADPGLPGVLPAAGVLPVWAAAGVFAVKGFAGVFAGFAGVLASISFAGRRGGERAEPLQRRRQGERVDGGGVGGAALQGG